ncbi:MAG: ABC transporter ATP-binding protein [Thalassobaculaceae bacterium]|nr:ABC transporter ATP-binding protein [Thalassobaculaceae bacterium]
MLASHDLTVSYGPDSRPVLHALSVAFARERFTALVGPNGCGKSTLLKAIMGFLKPWAGRVTLDGAPLVGMPRRELARRIAYLPQENFCPDHIRLGELVELGGYARYAMFGGPSDADRRLFEAALATVGLDGMGSVRVSAMSGGQRQRAWLAMVLAQDADTILLDEPVNHLDLKYQYQILDLVHTLTRRGKTVVAVLHDLNLTAAFADAVVMLKDGAVVAEGPTAEAVTTETVRRVFDFEADVFERDGRLVCLPLNRPGASDIAA